MNSREADAYVKKENIWKRPDYPALIQNGVPPGVAYFIKKARDSVETAPRYLYTDDTPEKRLARQKQYIETVRQVKAAVETVATVDEAINVFDLFMLGNGYAQKQSEGIRGLHYTLTERGRDNLALTKKLIDVLRVSSPESFAWKFTREATEKQFGVSDSEKIPNGFAIRYYDGKHSDSARNDWKPGTYYVTKKNWIVQRNLESRAAALQWAREHAKQKSAGGKKRFVPEQLAQIRREGPDYRQGRDVGGQDYLDTFGFRGGEFGNWMNQNDRQASLNMGFDALNDLAAALGISQRDISFQGTLAIAFGARGSGNAAAHYEPALKVINLTKLRGAGSLAHEWWHGLDDHLGEKMGAGKLLSENPRCYPLMDKLLQTIKFKPETPEQTAQRIERITGRLYSQAEKHLDGLMLRPLEQTGNEAALQEYAALKQRLLEGNPEMVEAVSQFRKTALGRVIPKDDRDTLRSIVRILTEKKQREQPIAHQVPTDYYQASQRIGGVYGRDGGYWDSDAELTARAFATYILDKLPRRSDYLAGHAESAVAAVPDRDGNLEIVRAFPQGAERRAINAVFDEIVQDLKREGILTHADFPLALDGMDTNRQNEEQAGEQITFSELAADKPSLLQQLSAARTQEKEEPAGCPLSLLEVNRQNSERGR